MTKKILLALIMLIAIETPAYAYLDPGTGSMILQALAATAIAIGLFWNKLVNAVKKLFKSKGAFRKKS